MIYGLLQVSKFKNKYANYNFIQQQTDRIVDSKGQKNETELTLIHKHKSKESFNKNLNELLSYISKKIDRKLSGGESSKQE